MVSYFRVLCSTYVFFVFGLITQVWDPNKPLCYYNEVSYKLGWLVVGQNLGIGRSGRKSEVHIFYTPLLPALRSKFFTSNAKTTPKTAPAVVNRMEYHSTTTAIRNIVSDAADKPGRKYWLLQTRMLIYGNVVVDSHQGRSVNTSRSLGWYSMTEALKTFFKWQITTRLNHHGEIASNSWVNIEHEGHHGERHCATSLCCHPFKFQFLHQLKLVGICDYNPKFFSQ